jgi:nuclear cap-binding protein subunit 1
LIDASQTILTTFLAPDSPHKPIYYISLLTELCKLSPTTVGPAVGKSIRRLYSYLSSGLDVEISRRFAEWFAVHMSNFGFGWVWKEWIPDLEMGGLSHPKKAFMRRAVEFEIRLSYHDRIKKTLPEKMQSPEAGVVGEEAPGPWFEYDDPGQFFPKLPASCSEQKNWADNPHHDTAQSVLNLFRGRAKAEDVITHLDALRSTLETSSSDLPIDDVDPLLRSICVQSLLHIGARSFSHLLNAIERYLPLLRQIVKQGEGDEAGGNEARKARSDVLSSASRFWERNRQMVGIVFDKLMQYQIVDPSDVVSWTFAHSSTHERRAEQEKGEELEVEGRSLSAFEWDLLRAALDKANGRVVIARRKVTALRKEEDERRARVRARDDTSMEVDAETKPGALSFLPSPPPNHS